jgi:hydroxyacylglutathione hydrolase
MMQEIQTIELQMPFHLGSVNCYLVKTGAGFLLIDTGMPGRRKALENALGTAGCRPGNLALILLTHGDFDHIGSAAYLRQKYGAKIAMHPGDAGMAELADMFWNRPGGNALFRVLLPVVLGFTPKDRFTPDVFAGEGFDLSPYGFKARVLELPGHSKGSIGILSDDGALFCGDQWMNEKGEPHLGIGDPADFAPGVERVKHLEVKIIYPGHGQPFSMK